MSSSSSSGGVGLFTLITAGLILGKLFEVQPVAGWSWWVVTVCMWGPLAVLAAIGVAWTAVQVFKD